MATPRRRKGTPAQLADWRIGHHVEAAGAMVSEALNRIGAAMEQANKIHAEEVELRREHLMTVLESKAVADRAAQRMLGLMGGEVPKDETVPREGPSWVKDFLMTKGPE